MKKIVSMLLATILIGNIAITNKAEAQSLEDALGSHWSSKYIIELYEKDVITSFADASKPDEAITRLEFMQYINRMFNLTDSVAISFTDVDNSQDYARDIEIAVAHGYIAGSGNGLMRPFDAITRQEAVAILSRLHKVEGATNTNLSFSDASQIDSWALKYIAYSVEKRYITGYTDNTFQPLKNLTRGEISRVLCVICGNAPTSTTISTSTVMNESYSNLTLAEPNKTYTVKDLVIEGDLYITAGAYNSTVNLSNLIVNGYIIVAGNDTEVNLNNVVCDQITSFYKETDISVDGSSSIGDVLFYSDASISGSNVNNLVTKTDGVEIDVEGSFGNMFLQATTNVSLVDTDLEKIYIIEGAENSQITMKNVSVIKSAYIQTEASIVGGYIYEVTITSTGVDLDCNYSNFNISLGWK